MGVIIDFFSAIGSFIGSIVDTFSYLLDFGRSLFTDFKDLLAVIPSQFSVLLTTFVMFSIILACKRALL